MTSVLDRPGATRVSPTRVAPSPVPLAQRSVPRDTSGNIWVQAPDPAELRLVAELEQPTFAAKHRRPSPALHRD